MNCNLIAPVYAFGERLCFGKSLEKRREEFLQRVLCARSAIAFGDGDGRFTAALLQRNETVRVTYVEKSGRMIAEARKRISRLGSGVLQRVEFYCSDALEFNSGETGFDLIVTHFFLDCLREQDLAHFAQEVSQWAAPNALWVVSEFRQAPSGWGRLWTGAVIRTLYGLFRLTTGLRVTQLPDYAKSLGANGFVPIERRVALRGLLVSELWEMSSDQDKEAFAPPCFLMLYGQPASQIIRPESA